MSHHGHNDIEKLSTMFEELKKHQEKLVGQYPDKKLVESDEGALAFGVSTMGEKVIIAFGEPTAWMGMTCDQAAELGLLLIKRAREAGLRKPPDYHAVEKEYRDHVNEIKRKLEAEE